MSPIITNDILQSTVEMSFWMIKGATIAPNPKPAAGIEIAKPLFEINHLGIVVVIGITVPLNPTPSEIPHMRYTCHIESIRDINSKPIPINIPAAVMNILGPYLSDNRPATIAKVPLISIPMETAPEMAPLRQPNSFVNGVKKIPKP
jgi:hypothetical protein